MKYHRVVGIDLGTTYSAVSVWDHDKKEVVVIPSAVGENTLPSVVGLDDEMKVIVGRPAQQRRVFDPQNTIIEIKREMGVFEGKPLIPSARTRPGPNAFASATANACPRRFLHTSLRSSSARRRSSLARRFTTRSSLCRPISRSRKRAPPRMPRP